MTGYLLEVKYFRSIVALQKTQGRAATAPSPPPPPHGGGITVGVQVCVRELRILFIQTNTTYRRLHLSMNT